MDISPSHRRLAIATGVGVIALGLAAGVAAMRPAPADRQTGQALQIALFTPPPPVIEAGTRMEVGDLTDGYEHRPAPEPDPVAWAEFEEGVWDVEVQDPPAPVAAVPPPEPIPVNAPSRDGARGDSMGFGFDSRAEAETRVMRPAPPERRPLPEGAEAPPRRVTSGERQALFY
ncbi:MAG: hypothetical protein KJ676_11660 [Alphaproteobacteria bacterium]|nr:hypothetical protein [Alphaproteobacteria bacterium]MBU1526003.1 hypothetical protein [Alphaproteobacteria bacterium]MBU2116352.1 hypothetical protein [Alphaproteobacteria bacterium]MBU2350411.1 hypothetical protein [Alphaproteobacteria bacterium]MBU2383255.1 hypothetical protein [Alphaproteobacteria bacterium]